MHPWSRAADAFESRGVALLVAVVTAVAITPWLPTLDDSYIVAHSADAIGAGWDSVYDVPALTGITSPAYLLCLLLATAIGLSTLNAIAVVTIAGVTSYLVGVWQLAGTLGATSWKRYALMAIGVMSGSIAVTITNGLETGCATALVVWAIVWVLEGRYRFAACAAGVLPWLRPDLLIVAAVVVILASRQAHTPLWRALLWAAVATLPFAIWIKAATGEWLPQTMAAKLVFFAEGCQPVGVRFRQAFDFLVMWMWLSTPIVLGLGAALFHRVGRVGLAAAIVALSGYAWMLPGALFHNDYRYLTALLVPWGLLGFGYVLSLVGGVGGLAAAALVAANATVSLPLLHLRLVDAQEFADMAIWVRDNVPRDSRILVHDAGALSFYAPNPLIDLVGLKTPSSIGVHRRLTWPSCGADRGRAMAEIARNSRPDYVVVIADWDRIFAITGALKTAGWTLMPVRTPIGQLNGYSVYRVASAGTGTRLRDAPAVAQAINTSNAPSDTAPPRISGAGW